MLFILSFHFVTAFILQLLGSFSYTALLITHIVLFAIVIWQQKWVRFNKVSYWKNFDWMLVGVGLIVGLYLYFVHYNYTGIISTITPPFYREVQNFSYPFPYYADEWYAIALVKDTFETQNLPTRQPLVRTHGGFVNLELAFHTTLGSMMHLVSSDPLYSYVPFSLLVNITLVVLLYLVSRTLGASRTASGIGSMLALYVTTGANLPGLWYLIPINLGLVSMFVSILLLLEQQQKLFFFGFFTTLVLYPPLIVFLAPTYFGYLLQRSNSKHMMIHRVIQFTTLIVTAAGIISLFFISNGKSICDLFPYVVNKILYASFTQNALPQYGFFSIVPVSLAVLSGIGAVRLWIHTTYRYLFLPILVGFGYWMVYAHTLQRFIIEYERLIFGVTMLLVVLASLGVQTLVDKVKLHKNHEVYIAITTIFIYGIFSLSYTARTNWQYLTLKDFSINQELKPSAPANDYLSEAEISLFSKYSRKKFLSLPWKGTVIGTATKAYPVTIKPGTISFNDRLFYEFWEGNCTLKEKIVRDRDIAIVYVPPMECGNFVSDGFSSEGLGVYRLMEGQ